MPRTSFVRFRAGWRTIFAYIATLVLLGLCYLSLRQAGVSERLPSEAETEASIQPSTSDEPMTHDELMQMVARTKGFYARDYSLWLGWNTIRYISETALLHASLLNRTLILPSFVYARACQYPHDACAAFAQQVNLGDIVGSDEWRSLPLAEQSAWRLPLTGMMDVELLRTRGHSVVTMREFLDLHGLPLELERRDGKFPGDSPLTAQPPLNENHTILREPLDVYRIENAVYDPSTMVRIDVPLRQVSPVPRRMKDRARRITKALAQFREMLEHGGLVRWEDAVAAIRQELKASEDDLEKWVRWAGYERLWSFGDGEDWSKSVVFPSSQLVLRARRDSFTAHFGWHEERIVHLRGEIHLGRPPGSIHFTTKEKRDAFARMVMWDVQPIAEVKRLARVVIGRMEERVGWRMWMGADMRGAHSVRHALVNATVQAHLRRVRERIKQGRLVLEEIQAALYPHTSDVPDPYGNSSLWREDLPRDNDPFFLGTDDSTSLQAFRPGNAVLLTDLLTPEDRTAHDGWPLLFGDVLGMIEQEVLSHAAFFYGSRMSSFTGGVLNARARLGQDARTGVVD